MKAHQFESMAHGKKLQKKSLEKLVKRETPKYFLSCNAGDIPCVWRDLLVRKAWLHNKAACLPPPTITTEQVPLH